MYSGVNSIVLMPTGHQSPSSSIHSYIVDHVLCWQNVSRLLDICRQSIYFESITGVLACVRAIQSDSDVVISRIKNRFEPTLDSDASAGYRNLAVNLRFVTTNARLLGVDMHICEVQLLLLHMAAIKVIL